MGTYLALAELTHTAFKSDIIDFCRFLDIELCTLLLVSLETFRHFYILVCAVQQLLTISLN